VRRVGVVGHKGYDDLPAILGRLVALAPTLGLSLAFEQDMHEVARSGERLDGPDDLDCLLALGGDGTLLRAARYLDGRPVPILGVNLGKLGFLTSCSARDMDDGLRMFARGEYRAEARMGLEATALGHDGNERERLVALNDVVLHKGGFARVLRLRVWIDGESIGAYSADGVVCSTPTGSTAYSLSAGGPVVVPTLESILVTPVSPHTLAIRPLILPPTAVVRLQTEDGPEELLVTVDGQVGTTFSSGQTLVVKRAPTAVRIVRFHGGSFFEVLRRKLGWGGLAERDDDTG
jgi:NAD+ kinase